MLRVWIPAWANSSDPFTIPVTLGNWMPSEAFLPSTDLNITGIELAVAAILSGRPWHLLGAPFSQANADFAQWRVTSCLRALEPTPTKRLRRPAAFQDQVDPSDKVYLSYSLGGAMTMAYLQHKLGIQWLAHYSLLSKHNPGLLQKGVSKSEPDYIGFDLNSNQYVVAEAKGRQTITAALKGSLDSKKQLDNVMITGQKDLRKYGVAVASGGPHLELYATDPTVVLDPPPIRTWIATYYEHLRVVYDHEREEYDHEREEYDHEREEGVVGTPHLPQTWVPLSIELPERVSDWVKTGADLDTWSDLVDAVRSDADSRDGRVVLPDLTVATINR